MHDAHPLADGVPDWVSVSPTLGIRGRLTFFFSGVSECLRSSFPTARVGSTTLPWGCCSEVATDTGPSPCDTEAALSHGDHLGRNYPNFLA